MVLKLAKANQLDKNVQDQVLAEFCPSLKKIQ
jgi:hypothetical protein